MSDSFQILLASSEKPCGIKKQIDEGEERNFQNAGHKQRRFGAGWKINRESVWRRGGNERRIQSFKNNRGFFYSSQTSGAYLIENSSWLTPWLGSPAEISKTSNQNSAISAERADQSSAQNRAALWIMSTQWSQRWPQRICKPRSSAPSPAERNSIRAWLGRKGLGFYLLCSKSGWKENLTCW